MSDLKTILESEPFSAALGLQVRSLTENAGQFALPYKDENSNPGKVLHGGVAASMIDIGGQAVGRAALGESSGPWHTCALEVVYLSAAIGETIIAEANLLRKGKELCFVDVAVRTEDGKPIARGISTVRGRFGAPVPAPITAKGDDGQSDPGPMGPHLAGRVPFIGRIGLKVEHMAGSRSRIVMPFQDRNAAGSGSVHEGPILALFDTTGAMASWAETGPGPYKASTVGVQAQMIASPGPEGLVAYGKVAGRDREIFWSEVEIASASSRNLVARGTVVYRIVIPEGK